MEPPSWLRRLKEIMWPSYMKTPFPGVMEKEDGTIEFSLTDEEANQADLALRAFKGIAVHPEAADKIRNGTIAVALCRYAHGLVATHCDANDESEYKSKWPIIRDALAKATAAVWKSYSLYPLPIFLYHRAVFLGLLGDKNQSRQLFSLFIKKQSEFKMDQVDQSLKDYEGTDIEHALAIAKERIEH